jgi:hypothetical protein
LTQVSPTTHWLPEEQVVPLATFETTQPLLTTQLAV